jgi:uncharacterized lipoprotein YmbA
MKIRILLAALALSGCATMQNDQAIAIAKQSLTAAHVLHDVFALSASAAARSNACVATCAVQAKDYLDRSAAFLKTADGLSDPTNIAADVAAAVGLLNQAKGLGL